jgi:hypothetical protein
MRIGILVGKLPSGKFETIGDIGDMAECKSNFNTIVDAGGIVKKGKSERKYIQLFVSDIARNPLKKRKC